MSQVAVVVLAFGTSIAQARLLGAEGRGDLARFVNAGALIALYFGLGISSAITYFVASGGVRPLALLRSLRRVYVATIVAVPVLLIAVGASPLARFLPQELSIGWSILALSVFFGLSQAASWITAVLAARGAFAPINFSSVAVGLVGAVASAGLLWAGPSWVTSATIIALLVGLEGLRVAVLVIPLARSVGATSTMPRQSEEGGGSKVSALQLWRYSALTYVGDAMQFLTYRFDMWVVDAYHGAAELGRYALAVSLAQLVWIVPTAMARVLFPYAAMMERSDGAALARRAALVALVVSGGLAVTGWIASQLFLTTLFGEEFAEVPFLLGILLLGVAPYSAAKVIGTYLAGTNAVGLNVAASGVVLAITLGLDLFLIPLFGAVGAAAATSVSYVLYTVALVAIFLRRHPASIQRVPWQQAER